MGNNNDGNGKISNAEWEQMQQVIRRANKRFVNEEKAKMVEFSGNSDAKLLAKAYEEYSKDGITKKERDLIEKFDDLLPAADIVISKAGDAATIAQDDGKTFGLKPKGHGK